jgi:hypothetical protein
VSRVVAFVAACALSLPAHAALTELDHFDDELAEHGVGAAYSEPSMTALVGLIRDEIASLRAAAASAEGKDRTKLERMADATAAVLDGVTARAGSSEADAAAASPALKSLLYSVRAEARGASHVSKIRIGLGVLGNLSLKLPYLSPDARARPLTAAQATLEAVNLIDPENGRTYSKPEELAGLSSDQVSRLDVRDDHPMWYAEDALRQRKARHPTAWSALEARVEARVSASIGAPYELDRARRILRFEGIKTSATSPKIDAEDLHGQGWKVKWGDEVQTEALANRLYVELGGKFADLVYANKGGPGDLVLVLDRPDPASPASSCDTVVTLEDLKRCLLASEYEFDVSAHVVGHGVITAEMLRQEPFSTATGEKQKLIGRRFVTFNESLVEFQPASGDFVLLGAGPMSSGGASSDRVKRGLAVFTYWIHNKDAKDRNNRGVIDRSSSTYAEYMHDMGASLGSLATSGNPNLLKVNDAFVRRRGDTVRFREDMLYLPAAFEAATYADAVWMARKIVALPRETIVACVAATQWPDFQQDVMVSRLIARRNAIARAFDVGATMAEDVAPRDVALKTPADRLDAVRRYRLAIATDADESKAVALLEQLMEQSGIAIQDGRADFEDVVDSWTKGTQDETGDRVLTTTPCRESLIVALLERTIHPAGLARRIKRGSDDKPLKACLPDRLAPRPAVSP